MDIKQLSNLVIFGVFLFAIITNNFAFAQNANLINGVVPTQITATLHDEYLDVAGKPVTTDDNWEFWNVGSLGGEQYAKAKLTIATTTMTWDGGTGEIPTTHSSVWEGTFSGGPNGKLTVLSEGYSIEGQLVDGRNIVYKNGKNAIVDNPDAFTKWTEKNESTDIETNQDNTKEDPESIKLPVTENWDEQPEGGLLDTSFPKVNKVMGDVELSDPDKRPSIWQKTWRFITNSGNWRVWEPAASGQQIKPDSSLKTTAGRAILEFADGTKFILDRESQITFNAAGGFTIENGTGYMEYRKYGKKIILQTRRGKFSIIGTTVSWEVAGDEVVFNVIEGKVIAESAVDGETLTLEAGEKAEFDYNDEMIKRDFDLSAESEYWKDAEQEAMKNSPGTDKPGWNWLMIIGVIALLAILGGLIIILVLTIVFRRRRKIEADTAKQSEEINN